jgi:hypothetical protein
MQEKTRNYLDSFAWKLLSVGNASPVSDSADLNEEIRRDGSKDAQP